MVLAKKNIPQEGLLEILRMYQRTNFEGKYDLNLEFPACEGEGRVGEGQIGVRKGGWGGVPTENRA